MALSTKLKERIKISITNGVDADELIAAIEASVASPASAVAALGSTSNIPTCSITLSTTDTYSDAAVKTAVDAGVNGVRIAAEARLDAIEAKVDSIIANLKASGQMQS